MDSRLIEFIWQAVMQRAVQEQPSSRSVYRITEPNTRALDTAAMFLTQLVTDIDTF
jgi:hypothetical protein